MTSHFYVSFSQYQLHTGSEIKTRQVPNGLFSVWQVNLRGLSATWRIYVCMIWVVWSLISGRLILHEPKLSVRMNNAHRHTLTQTRTRVRDRPPLAILPQFLTPANMSAVYPMKSVRVLGSIWATTHNKFSDGSYGDARANRICQEASHLAFYPLCLHVRQHTFGRIRMRDHDSDAPTLITSNTAWHPGMLKLFMSVPDRFLLPYRYLPCAITSACAMLILFYSTIYDTTSR